VAWKDILPVLPRSLLVPDLVLIQTEDLSGRVDHAWLAAHYDDWRISWCTYDCCWSEFTI